MPPDVATNPPANPTPAAKPNGKAKPEPTAPPEKTAEAKVAERNAKADALIEEMLSKAAEPDEGEEDSDGGDESADDGEAKPKPNGKAKAKVDPPVEGDESAEGDEAEPTAEEEARAKEKGLGFRVEQARKYKRQGQEALARAEHVYAQAQSALAKAERDGAQLESAREIDKAIRAGDFSGAIDKLARSMGITADEVLLAYAERKANGGKPGDSETVLEMRRLKAEIAAERAAAKRERDEAQRMGEMTQHQRIVHGSVQRIAAIRSNDELAQLWPHAASLPDDVFEAACSTLVDEALTNSRGRPVVLDDIAAKLDEYAGKLYASFSRSNRLRPQVPGDTDASERENPSGKGTPAAKVAKPAAKRTVTSQLAAESSARRELSQEERWAKADELAAGMARRYLAPDSDDSDD